MPTTKNNRRSSRRKSQRAKPRIDQEAIDDQKFQQKLETEQFTAGIEREANEQLQCLFSAEFSLLQVIQVLESDDNDDPRAHESLEQERRKDLVVAFLPWLRSSEQFD
jgi:hypothetical protein